MKPCLSSTTYLATKATVLLRLKLTGGGPLGLWFPSLPNLRLTLWFGPFRDKPRKLAVRRNYNYMTRAKGRMI